MQTRKPATESEWVDSDDAPHLTRRWFERADLFQGDKTVRGGRPKSASPKEAVNLRLDADGLKYFRNTGPGRQSRINEALRKVAVRSRRVGVQQRPTIPLDARALRTLVTVRVASRRKDACGRQHDCYAAQGRLPMRRRSLR
jgi:uncharacterized protein (DUF4415 family)